MALFCKSIYESAVAEQYAVGQWVLFYQLSLLCTKFHLAIQQGLALVYIFSGSQLCFLKQSLLVAWSFQGRARV